METWNQQKKFNSIDTALASYFLVLLTCVISLVDLMLYFPFIIKQKLLLLLLKIAYKIKEPTSKEFDRLQRSVHLLRKVQNYVCHRVYMFLMIKYSIVSFFVLFSMSFFLTSSNWKNNADIVHWGKITRWHYFEI